MTGVTGVLAGPCARGALGACLLGLATHACASWRCVDPWSHVYVSGQDLTRAGMQCDWQDPQAQDGPAASVDAPAAVSVGPRRGMLVLAPAARVPGWLLPGPVLQASVGQTPYDPLIASVASAYGQDAALLRAIVQVESRFDPNAVSSRGAIGLMQVMPATAAEFGLPRPERALFEPESNLRTGAQVLRNLLRQFAGNTELALAAYNAGPGAVIRSGYAVPDFPETQQYVRSVLAIWHTAR